jgi:hypothetical protein
MLWQILQLPSSGLMIAGQILVALVCDAMNGCTRNLVNKATGRGLVVSEMR